MSDDELGVGYLTVDDLSGPHALALGAFEEAQYRGFVLSEVTDYPQLILQYPRMAIPLDAYRGRGLGLLKTIIVAREHRQRGIARHLMTESLRLLREGGSETVLLFAWLRNGDAPAAPLARKFSFQEIGRVDGLWRETSIARNFQCATCGRPPCNCSALIYVRDGSADVPPVERTYLP